VGSPLEILLSTRGILGGSGSGENIALQLYTDLRLPVMWAESPLAANAGRDWPIPKQLSITIAAQRVVRPKIPGVVPGYFPDQPAFPIARRNGI